MNENDEDRFGQTDPALLIEELRSYLPIEVDGKKESSIENKVWELIEEYSGGCLNSMNTLVVLNRNQITHLKLVKKKAPLEFKPGNILVPLQARELVIERFQEWTMFYDNDLRFDSAYLVIDYREGCSTILLEELDSKRRGEYPVHWFEMAQVFGGGRDIDENNEVVT